MKKFSNDSVKHVMMFDSAAQWAQVAKDNAPYGNEFMDNEDLKYDDWSGNKDGNTNAKNISANKADSDKVEKVHASQLNAQFNTTEFNQVESMSMYNDEYGLMLDSNAYFNGEESCMLNVDIATPVKPIINIFCNIGGQSDIEPHQFINRGIALIRAVHALERAGVSVGLVGYSKSDTNTLQLIEVKKPQDSLNEQTLVNIFADCSPFRTIGFTHREICGVSIGATQTLKEKHLQGTKYVNMQKVILPYDRMTQYEDDTTATNWTVEQIKQQAQVAL